MIRKIYIDKFELGKYVGILWNTVFMESFVKFKCLLSFVITHKIALQIKMWGIIQESVNNYLMVYTC